MDRYEARVELLEELILRVHHMYRWAADLFPSVDGPFWYESEVRWLEENLRAETPDPLRGCRPISGRGQNARKGDTMARVREAWRIELAPEDIERLRDGAEITIHLGGIFASFFPEARALTLVGPKPIRIERVYGITAKSGEEPTAPDAPSRGDPNP